MSYPDVFTDNDLITVMFKGIVGGIDILFGIDIKDGMTVTRPDIDFSGEHTISADNNFFACIGMKFNLIAESAFIIDNDLSFVRTCKKDNLVIEESAVFTDNDFARTDETSCFYLHGFGKITAVSDTEIGIGSHIETEIFNIFHAVTDNDMAVFATEYDFGNNA